MDMFEGLQQEADARMEGLRPAIEKLRTLGIEKELHMRAASNIVVTYPSKQDLDPGENVSVVISELQIEGASTLYVHVPFCSAICSYCDFARSASGAGDTKIQDYFRLLASEATMWKNRAGAAIPVESIYIGGGTPTLLTPDALENLFEIIRTNFALCPDGEYTLEASPGTIDAEKLTVARNYGVNRVSMGAESFNSHILTQMHRESDVAKIFSAIDTIRAAGIEHIDIDLIRGYPGQTSDDLLNDLRGMHAANTPSVTSYQYSLKPHAIDKKKLGQFSLEQDKLINTHLMFIAGAERIGYRHQAPLVDWFIKDDKWIYQQQVQKWLGMVNLISVGLGTYGYVNGMQYINYEDRRRYGNTVRAGSLPVEKAAILSREEQMHRKMIFGLKGYIDRGEFRDTYGVDVLQAPFKGELEAIAEAGGIDITDTHVTLSKAGQLFADWIQMSFYSPYYKAREKSRTIPLAPRTTQKTNPSTAQIPLTLP